MQGVMKDLRWALRVLIRRPGFAVVAVVTLALGIGATTTMFSVLYGVVIKPLAFNQPERIVVLRNTAPDGGHPPWAGANYVDFVAQSSAYEAIAGFRYMDYSLQGDPYPTSLLGASVTPEFFQVFGVPPALGRTFSSQTDGPGMGRTAVLSNRLWQTQFAADPQVVGRVFELNGESFTIVGVMPAGLTYPWGVEIWTSARFRAPDLPGGDGTDMGEDRDQRYFGVVARLGNGVSLDHAEQEGQAIVNRLAEMFPDMNRKLGLEMIPLHERTVAAVRPMLLVLFGAVALLLVIACSNVSSLLLARIAGRTHEIAVRKAMGAGRVRIARGFLTESIVLGVLGGTLGVLLAIAGTRGLLALASSQLPRAGEVSINVEVLVFSLATSLFAALLFGLAPVLWVQRRDPATVLQEAGGRSVVVGANARLRGVLVSAQVALSLVLLVGAGLMARTLWVLSKVDPGFTEREAVTAQVWLPGSGDLEPEQIRAFQNQVLEKVRALPGVRNVGAVLSLPVGGGIQAHTNYSIEGIVVEPGAEPVVGLQAASPGYFRSIGIPLISGRTFAESDGPESEPVVVVSQAFADRFLQDREPIGTRIGNGSPQEQDFEWATIVGVVGSTRYDSLDAEPRAEVYQPMAQASWPYMTLVLQTSLTAQNLREPLRKTVMEIQVDQPVDRVVSLEQILAESLSHRRVNMILLSVFAGLALVLASVGLYGVLSFLVVQRSREIAIRVAVGAQSGDIIRLVLGQSGKLLGIGLGVGIVVSLVLGRLVSHLLYQVSPMDPVTFGAAAVTLGLAGLLAVFLPALRAVKTHPVDSLRSEV